MHPLLSRDHYFSTEVFEAERRNIFKRLWTLVALRPMVAGHLDYRTIEIAGVPLIVQNLAGRIRCFANICRHRLGRIHSDDFGSRPLVCPYHHWSYDDNGVLRSVPHNASLFRLSESEKSEMRLQEFAVEVVGGLVFVNLDPSPLPITEQFAPELLATLASATSRMDSEYVHTRFEASFNWKTGIENIKDPLHVHCLHSESFPSENRTKLDQLAAATVNPVTGSWPRISLAEATNSYHTPIEGGTAHAWQSLVEKLDSKGHYTGIHLFPNVNLMIVDGTSFSVQTYNPLGPEKTEMQMTVVLTRAVEPFDYRPVVLWEILKSDMKVLREDIEYLEALQPNFRVARHDVFHGAYETWIMDFHSAYRGVMDSVPARA